MVTPYVVRFVSLRSGSGKTLVAKRVLEYFKYKGYMVGVIKHCSHAIELEEKDSKEYLNVGASLVVVSSPGLAIVYRQDHQDSLESTLLHILTPIVIVEGYKEEKIGEVVLVIRDQLELEEMYKRVNNVIAVIASTELVGVQSELQFFKFGEESKLAQFIEERAFEFLSRQLPLNNCGACGYSDCHKLLSAYLRGQSAWCPIVSDVKVLINGLSIPLNPFVKNFIRSTITGMIQSLRGVPKNYRDITIVIRD